MTSTSPETNSDITVPSTDNGWDALADTEGGDASIAPEYGEFYKAEVKRLLEKTPNNMTMREILASGTINGEGIGSDIVRRNVNQATEERLLMARLVERGGQSQRLAEIIAEWGVCGFHGTNQSALAGMLEAGALLSAQDLNEAGDHMVSGEHVYSEEEGGQSTISFAALGDSPRVMQNYAGPATYELFSSDEAAQKRLDEAVEMNQLADQIVSQYGEGSLVVQHLRDGAERKQRMAGHIKNNPDSLRAIFERTRFPVVVGVTGDFVERSVETGATSHATLLSNVAKDLGEFRIAEKIPMGEIPLILVPEVIAPWTKEVLRRQGYGDIEVQPLELLYAV